MAEEFLSFLSGLAQGVDTGLERKRDRNERATERNRNQQNLEAQRAFQLKQFDAEQRRAAALDALNEEVSKSRMALQERLAHIEEDRAQREAHNSEEIPYVKPDGGTINVPRSMARDLQGREVMAQMERSGMVETPYGFMSPADFARTSQFNAEQTARRSESANRAVNAVYEISRQQGSDHRTALREALSYGTTTYPNIYDESLLDAFQKEGGEEVMAQELGIGPLGRLQLGGAGLFGMVAGPDRELGSNLLQASVAPDAVEGLRYALYGTKPPQTLEQLQIARESAGAAERSQSNQALRAALR